MAKIEVNVSEIKDRPALPEGPYNFRVDDFSDITVDKNGNQYIKAKLRFNQDGEVYIVGDNYLRLDSTHFRDFIRSTGHNDYISDTIELIGLEGSCILIQQVLDDGRIVNNVQKYLPKK